MNTLPQLGEKVQLFGVGCEGCGNFEGEFCVAAVLDGRILRLTLTAREVHCDGAISVDWLSRVTVEWNNALRCWQADCGGRTLVINISRHLRGSAHAAA
jgi:hypothetical protein